MRAAIVFWPLAALLIAPATAYAAPVCLASGQSFAIGQSACLSIAGKEHLARCEMVLNNTSWTKIEEDCAQGDAYAPQDEGKPSSKPAPSEDKPAEPAAN